MSAVPGGGILLGPTPDGATRRTTTIMVAPRGDWLSDQRVTAIGRDLCRTAGDGVRMEHDGFSFDIDAAGLIVPDETPSGSGRRVPEELRGQFAQRGLRKRVAELRADQRSSASVLLGPEGGLFDTLLDDVVGTSLASGYGMLYEGSNATSGSQIGSAMRMTCVGFNTMNARGEVFDVQRYFEKKPPSIEFVEDDPLVWHDDLPMRPNTFRRRRMLQVAPQPTGQVAVTGYFRDTFMRPDGVEMVVHEYGLNATVSGRPLVLDSVEAVPGNLPLDHCPLAARSALTLEGLPLTEVEQAVRRDVAGPAGCTHLNDELRALRLVQTLIAARA